MPSCAEQGSLVCVAKRTFQYAGKQTCELYAIAVHDIYGSEASKWLKMYSTGKFLVDTMNVFVAKEIEAGIASTTLFSLSKAVCPHRTKIEDIL